MEEEKPNYYAVIPSEVRYDEQLKPMEKLLYGEITALTFATGECWASNNYFARLYKTTPQAISKWITNLKRIGYVNIDYDYSGKEIKKRIIRVSTPVDTYQHTIKGGINTQTIGYQHTIKENNTSINNTSINNNKLNEFNLYNNYHQNEKCECITKSTNKKCLRRSSFNINGKNYCNQHARDLIPNINIIDGKKLEAIEIAEKVVNRLNELNNTKYAATNKSTLKLIKGRLDEGYTEEDLMLVVEKMSYLWNQPGKEEMKQYLRPSTLFRPTNFENYLNMPVREQKRTTKNLNIDFMNFLKEDNDD